VLEKVAARQSWDAVAIPTLDVYRSLAGSR
jgi:hypothetical protein